MDAFLEPLKDTLSCVVRAKICLSHDGYGRLGATHGLTVNSDTEADFQSYRSWS